MLVTEYVEALFLPFLLGITEDLLWFFLDSILSKLIKFLDEIVSLIASISFAKTTTVAKKKKRKNSLLLLNLMKQELQEKHGVRFIFIKKIITSVKNQKKQSK